MRVGMGGWGAQRRRGLSLALRFRSALIGLSVHHHDRKKIS